MLVVNEEEEEKEEEDEEEVEEESHTGPCSSVLCDTSSQGVRRLLVGGNLKRDTEISLMSQC